MRMPLLHPRHLSYANVTATLALLVATSTGGAYAAATIGSGDIKKDAVKSRHIAAGGVKTSDLADGGVTSDKLADGSVTATKLGDGSVHPTALSPDVAAPSAYGTIWWDGTSVTNARNLTSANVTHPQVGVYCIQDLPFTPSMALVNSAYQPNAFHHDLEVYGLGGNWGNAAPCPSASQIQIRVYNPGTTTAADGDFNIAIF